MPENARRGRRYQCATGLHRVEAGCRVSLSTTMDEGSLTIRVVLCDIYNTLLEVGPAPADERWEKLCCSCMPAANAPALDEFAAAAECLIARAHAAARAIGVRYPEIFWPAIAGEAWP